MALRINNYFYYTSCKLTKLQCYSVLQSSIINPTLMYMQLCKVSTRVANYNYWDLILHQFCTQSLSLKSQDLKSCLKFKLTYYSKKQCLQKQICRSKSSPFDIFFANIDHIFNINILRKIDFGSVNSYHQLFWFLS